jgi:putative OPT family oligopeptide transporter
MVPLRDALIVQEHGTLPYPEGMACSEVLIAGEEGGSKAGLVFVGLGISAAYKFITDGLKVFPSEVTYDFNSYKGAGIGMDVLPSLLGVGYICGPKISSYMMAGGAVSWFVLMPLIYMFGVANPHALFPASQAMAKLGTSDIWGSYIKYIGAGAVAAGGIMSLIKSLPLIINTFAKAFKEYGKGMAEEVTRTSKNLPMKAVLIGVVIIAIALWLLPDVPVNLLGAIMIIIFGFFFVTVSARMVGIVGSSNNPVSGMTIAVTDGRPVAGVSPEAEVLTAAATRRALALMAALPAGVQRMSDNVAGLVETSLNWGVATLDGDGLLMRAALRSSVGTAYRALAAKVRWVAESLGAAAEMSGEYPAWEWVEHSVLRDKMARIYRDMFGKELVIEAIHAGVECGLLAGKIADLDAISMGPDILDIHTPQERLSISSTKRMYDFIVKIIETK